MDRQIARSEVLCVLENGLFFAAVRGPHHRHSPLTGACPAACFPARKVDTTCLAITTCFHTCATTTQIPPPFDRQPESRRNSTYAVSDFPEDSWPVPAAGWADEFLKLSGPELYRVALPERAVREGSGTFKAWAFIREWAGLWKESGSGLTTPVSIIRFWCSLAGELPPVVDHRSTPTVRATVGTRTRTSSAPCARWSVPRVLGTLVDLSVRCRSTLRTNLL